MPDFTTTPDLHGFTNTDYDGRYRIYTIASGIAFDSVPAYDQGGPASVAFGDWNVSTTHSSDRPGVYTLKVWRGDAFKPTRHQLDGTDYPTLRDADRAAYDAGVTGFMVYEKHAFRYWLPVDVTAVTDLAELVGVRVRIDRPAPDSRTGGNISVHYGVFESLRHSRMIPDSAGGILLEEPHGTCPGGATGFSVPYGSAITRADRAAH
jgi:hypothetical protein